MLTYLNPARRQDKQWVGSAIAKSREQPGNRHHEIVVGSHVQERTQRFDGTTVRRCGQRPHARLAFKPNGWGTDHSPAIGVDLNGAPFLIAKVNVDFTAKPSHADMNVSFGTVELGLSFELLQRAIEVT